MFTLVWISANPDKEPVVDSAFQNVMQLWKYSSMSCYLQGGVCYNSKTLILLILVLKLTLICIFLLMYFWEIALLLTMLILITSYLSQHHERCRS